MNYPEMNGFNDSAMMEKYPGLEQSLQAWRFRHHIYNDICQKRQDATKLTPQSSLAPLTQAASSVTTKPQHSVAENIFRRAFIAIQVFDVGGDQFFSSTMDGDSVDVYFNGQRVFTNLPLFPYPGRKVYLTLQPSDLMQAKTNQLYFVAKATFEAIPDPTKTASVGVNVDPIHAATLFHHETATNIRLYPRAIRYLLKPYQSSPILNLAVGLMCFDHTRWPESTQHVIDAQAGIPDSKGRIHRGGIQSVQGYPIYDGKDRDEYPPKEFVENAGFAHVRSIKSSDNQGSGGFMGRLLTPYNQSDQLELVDALIDSPLGGKLYCKDAYTQ